MEKNAATGNDRKLAAIRPIAASSAIQQKMMPSPRAKFIAKPPSGYSTSMPSSSGNNSDVFVDVQERDGQHALVVEKIGRDLKFVKCVRRQAHRFALPPFHFLRITGLPHTGKRARPPAMAVLNLMRSCSGRSRSESLCELKSTCQHAVGSRRHELKFRFHFLAFFLLHLQQIAVPTSSGRAFKLSCISCRVSASISAA